MAKDCPDRLHPSFNKNLSPAELDAYIMGKSKGKGHKGKSKDGMMAWSNDDVWYHDAYAAMQG